MPFTWHPCCCSVIISPFKMELPWSVSLSSTCCVGCFNHLRFPEFSQKPLLGSSNTKTQFKRWQESMQIGWINSLLWQIPLEWSGKPPLQIVHCKTCHNDPLRDGLPLTITITTHPLAEQERRGDPSPHQWLRILRQARERPSNNGRSIWCKQWTWKEKTLRWDRKSVV